MKEAGKRRWAWTLLAVVVGGSSAVAADPVSRTSTTQTETTTETTGTPAGGLSSRDARSVISPWPSPNKNAAQVLLNKYGPPDAVMDRMLVWNDRSPWHKIAVYRDSAPVDAPTPRQTYIENSVNYKVPSNQVASLVQFDPALVIDLTRGTLSAQGDSEKSNILALNLADEIVTGKRTVASASQFMRDSMEKEMAGKSSGYSDRLFFTPSGEMTPAGEVNPARTAAPSQAVPEPTQPSQP